MPLENLVPGEPTIAVRHGSPREPIQLRIFVTGANLMEFRSA
jgi:hypothetical protein